MSMAEWQEYQGPARDVVRMVIHHDTHVAMDAAHLAEFAERIRRIACTELARIEAQRQPKCQPHISRTQEYDYILAEMYIP